MYYIYIYSNITYIFVESTMCIYCIMHVCVCMCIYIYICSVYTIVSVYIFDNHLNRSAMPFDRTQGNLNQFGTPCSATPSARWHRTLCQHRL